MQHQHWHLRATLRSKSIWLSIKLIYSRRRQANIPDLGQTCMRSLPLCKSPIPPSCSIHLKSQRTVKLVHSKLQRSIPCWHSATTTSLHAWMGKDTARMSTQLTNIWNTTRQIQLTRALNHWMVDVTPRVDCTFKAFRMTTASWLSLLILSRLILRRLVIHTSKTHSAVIPAIK